MCSVIEIKNANEYYIHYHSPESMVTPAASEVSIMSSEKIEGVGVDGGGRGHQQTKEANNISNDVEAAETSTKLKSSKDQEVTSDRGSSASPSLEDEEEIPATPQQQKTSVEEASFTKTASEANNKSPSSKIPVRSFKKLPAPQPPTTSQQTTSCISSTSTPPTTSTPNTKSKSKSKGTNPFETGDENEEKKQPQQSRPRSAAASSAARSALPRPSPPKSSPASVAAVSVASKSKLTPARSCESVPITVNSHIPASPLRPTGLNKRRVTSEMATQVETASTTTTASKSTSSTTSNNKAMKSASEENLANLEVKAKKPNLFKKTSESSDPICNTGSNAKWSYTNGRKNISNFLLQSVPKKNCIVSCLAVLNVNYFIEQSVNSKLDSNRIRILTRIVIFFSNKTPTLATHKLRLECADNNNKL